MLFIQVPTVKIRIYKPLFLFKIMASTISTLIAFGVFYAWISMVGNPHVIETSIGVVLAIASWIWSYLKIK